MPQPLVAHPADLDRLGRVRSQYIGLEGGAAFSPVQEIHFYPPQLVVCV